jgi:hypothetical protein
MPRYTLTVILNDNTELTFDSKRAGGLDHLFEHVGSFISKVGNDTVRECLLTTVPEDAVLEFSTVSPQRQEMYEQHKTGLSFSPTPMALEQLLSAEPVGAACLLARRMSLATMTIRNTPEWRLFLESEAYQAYLRLLDSPLAATPESLLAVKEGYNAYRQAIIDYGTEHKLLKPLLPR